MNSRATAQGVVRRCRIVLLALDGLSPASIAMIVGVSRATVKLWTARFALHGPNGLLHDAPGRGRHALLDPTLVREQLKAAGLLGADGQPASLRGAAAVLGVSASSLWRTLKRDAK